MTGFWKRNNESSLVVKCPTSEACLAANETYPLGLNGLNYEQSSCLYFKCKPGYGRSFDDKCQKCLEPIWNKLILFGVLILSFAYTFYQFYLLIPGGGISNFNNVVIKILFNHLEQLALLNIMELNFSEKLRRFFMYQNVFTPLTTTDYAVQCVSSQY